MFRLLKSPQPTIRFLCAPEDEGVIARPVPAKSELPDWFRRLPPVDKAQQSATDTGLTIKRCMPFLDAMTTGWIIPLAATVRLEVKDGGKTVTAGWEYDKQMVSNHSPRQIDGHPMGHLPPMKFHNFWQVRTNPGWSCLFVPPLNRQQSLFQVLSGVVDTDSYHALINFPFIPTAPDGVHVIEKGTPLVQVIPFRCDGTAMKAEIGTETREEGETRERQRLLTRASEGWYRTAARAKR